MDQKPNNNDSDSKSSIELINAKNWFNKTAGSAQGFIIQTSNGNFRLTLSPDLANEAFKALNAEAYKLFSSMGLSMDALEIILDCRDSSLSRLAKFKVKDMQEIFNSIYLNAENLYIRFQRQKGHNNNNCGPPIIKKESKNPTLTEDLQFNLREILEKHVDGENIFKKYAVAKILNDKDQMDIVRIIVDYFLLHKIKMDLKVMENLATSITKLFPTESTKTYYIPGTKNKNACGKLYDCYFIKNTNKRKSVDDKPTTSKSRKTNDEPK